MGDAGGGRFEASHTRQHNPHLNDVKLVNPAWIHRKVSIILNFDAWPFGSFSSQHELQHMRWRWCITWCPNLRGDRQSVLTHWIRIRNTAILCMVTYLCHHSAKLIVASWMRRTNSRRMLLEVTSAAWLSSLGLIPTPEWSFSSIGWYNTLFLRGNTSGISPLRFVA